jgi:hypothetical protein
MNQGGESLSRRRIIAMPIRNGKIVKWEHSVEEFGKTIGRSDLSTKDKLKKLAEIVRKNEKIFSEGHDDFEDELINVIEAWGHDEDELETEGNYVINQIYNYADENLIWLGFP